MKEQLLQCCWDYVNSKMQSLQQRSRALQESLHSETKSSAGDKHETGRAMVQLEQEKLGKQLFELEQTKKVLQKIVIAKDNKKVVLGSLVRTTASNYFIAISAGEFKIDNMSVFCISAGSPIGKLLLGKEMGAAFRFRGKTFHIENIV